VDSLWSKLACQALQQPKREKKRIIKTKNKQRLLPERVPEARTCQQPNWQTLHCHCNLNQKKSKANNKKGKRNFEPE
jgi:hypothetical protein